VALRHACIVTPYDARLFPLAAPSSPQARAVRLLRHRLLAHGDPRVILVTSARPNEGKTTCAASLALVFAEESFAKVLLVEANQERPALARAFGVPPLEAALPAVETGNYPVTGLDGTRLSLAGLGAPGSGRLDRGGVRRAMTELREAYDYVLLDAASVLESADVDVLAEVASGVLVAARARATKKSDLVRALEMLSPEPVLGVVLLEA
jgi:Mrp family chromosome partitioning ATPase